MPFKSNPNDAVITNEEELKEYNLESNIAASIGELGSAFLLGAPRAIGSGLAGLGTLALTQDAKRAADVTENIQTPDMPQAPLSRSVMKGVGDFSNTVKHVLMGGESPAEAMGQATLQVTDSPGAATFAHTLPTAAMLLFGRGMPGKPQTVRPPKTPGFRFRSPQELAEAKALVALGKKEKVPVYTSDVIPPQGMPAHLMQGVSEKIPGVGMLRPRLNQQEARLASAQRYAAQHPMPPEGAIVGSVMRRREAFRKAAGGILEQGKQRLDRVGPIPTPATDAAFKRYGNWLKGKEVAKSPEGLDAVRSVQQALKTPQVYSTLKQNRSFLRATKGKLEKGELGIQPDYAKTMLDDLYNSMGQDLDDFARANLSTKDYGKLARADMVWGEEARKFTRSAKLRGALRDVELDADKLNKMVFSNSRSDLNLLHRSLDQAGRNDARALIINKMVNNAGGPAELTPKVMLKQFDNFAPQIRTFFRASDKKQLEGLRRLWEATNRASMVEAPGQVATGLWSAVYAAGLLFKTNTAIGIGSTAGATRLYNMPVVRDHLIKLATTPRGPKYNQALVNTAIAIRAEAEAIEDLPEFDIPNLEQAQSVR